MKKAIAITLFLITLTFIVVGCGDDISYTDDLKVDENYFRGVNGDVQDCVIVWVDVEKNAFNENAEYGICLFDASKPLSVRYGKFTKSDKQKESFAVSYNANTLKEDKRFCLKGYVKIGSTSKFSKNSVYFET